MVSKPEVRELIDGVLEEEALLIGGLIATHEVEDDFVWHLFRSLDVIRTKALDQLGDCRAKDGEPNTRTFAEPHPAIEEFLRRLGRE